eukprot:GFUD01005582.1.p1 GENE.GFUD01005582.1~~GFUD01005582.1.p1  ORF type:complete len:150 (+),score=27.31 GFUD01005582.1:22-450(+)
MEQKIIEIGSIIIFLLLLALSIALQINEYVLSGILVTIIVIITLVMLVMLVMKYCSPHPIPPESVNTRSCPPQTNIVNRPGTLYSVYMVQTQGLNQQHEQAVYQTRIAENTLPSGQRQETSQTPGHPPDSDEPPSYEIAIHM